MVSEAQRKASAKYDRLNTKSMSLKFSRREFDLVDYLGTKDSKATYVKQLIREDMERQIERGAYKKTDA